MEEQYCYFSMGNNDNSKAMSHSNLIIIELKNSIEANQFYNNLSSPAPVFCLLKNFVPNKSYIRSKKSSDSKNRL